MKTPTHSTTKTLTHFLMSQKGVHSNEYMESWQRFNERPWPDKKEIPQKQPDNITLADYKHTRKIWEGFRIQNLVEHHNPYMQIISRCIWMLLLKIHKEKEPWSCISFVSTRISTEEMSDESKRRNGIVSKFRYPTNGK